MITAFLSSFSMMTNAQNTQADQSRFDSVRELIPVVIQGVRVNNKTPYAVSNLNEKEIRENNIGQDIPYLLNYTPSVVVNSDAGAGVGYTGIRIRGTDAERINFTINGIPVNDAESQSAIFVDFPDLLSSTNSIQIQRGVGSSTNGAGAFGASINISNLNQVSKPTAEINNSFGSFNTLKHTIKAGTGMLKGGFQFDARASKISSDGYIDRSASDLKSFQFIAGWTSKNEKTNLKFNLFTGIEKTGQAWNGIPEDSLKTNRTYNEIGQKADGTYYKDQTDNYQQDYYQLFLDHKFSKNWKGNIGLFLTRGKGYYNEYRVQDKFSDYGLPPYTTPNADTFKKVDLLRQRWLDNNYYGGVFSLAYEKAATQLIFGGSLTRYEGSHYGFIKWADFGIPVDYRWYLNDAVKDDRNIYVKLQQQIGQNFFVFGDMQYRNVHHDMDGFRNDPTAHPIANYNFLNPKLGLSFIKNHQSNQLSKAYLSFALAHKEPNRKDFEESPLAFPKPEKLYDIEGGYDFQSSRFSAGANLYYMYYVDQLVYSGKINDYGVYSRINVGKSYRAGIELTAAYKVIPQIEIAANATISQNKIQQFDEYIDDYDNGGQIKNTYKNTDISFSPNMIASGIISFSPFKNRWNNQDINMDVLGKYVGRQYLDNTTNKQRSINPYGLVDLRFRYNIQPSWIKNIGVSLALNNVLNKKYEANGYTFSYQDGGQLQTENYYFPQAGFNFLLGVNLTF